MKLVVIEANIGTGKSTMLPKLVSELNKASDMEWVELQEPVDDPKFQELLKEFYEAEESGEDATEVRIRFQKYITHRRTELCRGLDQSKGYVLERSLLSDIVFCQANMFALEHSGGEYKDYFYDIKRRLKYDYPKIDMCIYLRANPVMSHIRVKKRGRDGEQNIPLEYIEDIHNYHEACLPQLCRSENIPMLVYNWDNPQTAGKFCIPMMVQEIIKE